MTDRLKLTRRRPFRIPLPRILIVCEGRETEPGYFTALRHDEKIPIKLDINGGWVPKTVVERAVTLKREAEAEARRRHDDNLRYDQVWCVFDIDEHPGIAEAKQQARDNAISLAISNPCFELWLLLHFQDQRSYISRSAIHHECVKHMPGYGKKVPFEILRPHYAEAVRRSRALNDWQRSRDCAEETNPWTGVHELTELIKTFGRERATG